ncbi:MAG: heat-inducible transcriptional repressor HrcA [Candidatus Nanopelagicales bacterium]|jgi:heat-inducible transcriptional repressor|nr:heat-inducible transcriptional repressor HrcA [Candidatus Nanopelagicales bacterium]
MLDERKLAVLRAIVEDYVRTHEPVGSKALVERHALGVSPATIRNDMAVLEEEGFIAQPHTSAGRIPTDKGYRLFVDRLSAVKPLSPAERRAIERFLGGAVDLDDVMGRSVRLLAQLTRQVALVQYPSLTSSAVRHVELVTLSEHRILLVLIADTGRIEQRVVEVPASLDDATLARLRVDLNEAVGGRAFTGVADRVADLPERFDEASRPTVSVVLATLLETVVERHEERVVLGGTANLTRYVDGFGGLQPVLEALEEQMVLLRLLGETGADITVTIGHENPVAGMSGTSVVSAGYGPTRDSVARLGVVGPTHMDYPSTMASVRAVARYLGQLLRTE